MGMLSWNHSARGRLGNKMFYEFIQVYTKQVKTMSFSQTNVADVPTLNVSEAKKQMRDAVGLS